jgi:hypothetical protein
MSLNPFHFIFSNPLKPSFFLLISFHPLIFCLVPPKKCFFEKRKKKGRRRMEIKTWKEFSQSMSPLFCLQGRRSKREKNVTNDLHLIFSIYYLVLDFLVVLIRISKTTKTQSLMLLIYPCFCNEGQQN